MLLSFSASAQHINTFEKNQHTINSFFDKYKEAEGVTRIKIGSAMTKLLAVTQFEAGDDASAKLLRSIKSIDILVENSAQSGNIIGDMLSLPDECIDFEMITSINEGGETSNFYFAQHLDTPTCEFLMLVQQSGQRVVLYITGEFSISDISALSSLSDGIGI